MQAIEVKTKTKDARDKAFQQSLEDAGIKAETKVSDTYYIEGKLSEKDYEEIAQKLLTDNITQKYSTQTEKAKGQWIIEVRYKDNVTEPAEESILTAIRELGKKADSARTATRYYIKAELNSKDTEKICKLLANNIVEECRYGYEELKAEPPKSMQGKATDKVNQIRITTANDSELTRISKEGTLALNLEEMKAIRQHFTKLGREPTDAEIETIAQTWSEHCKHKTFNSQIEFNNQGKKETIQNLFRETIAEATQQTAKKKKWLVSTFKDNAGIIELDEKNNLAIKAETHNHPSALEPYGGASTGVGGVIRDILGAGLGAKPIFNTDVFCFAPPEYDGELPEGILHPKRILKGVASGVRDYGNRMGIPTVNGAIIFHNNYLGAPLVYCGTGGIIPKGMENKKASKEEAILVIGGKTGRDGLHGATFSSAELEQTSPSSAVQIGNPIEEKKMTDALLQCRDEKLYTFITDCGGGGFSSAIGELAAQTGAEVWLEKAPIKHAGIKPWEIWMSESQERMIITAPKQNITKIKQICEKEGTEATEIGKITDTKKLAVKYNGKKIIELDMNFLHNGLPKGRRKAEWKEKEWQEPELTEKDNYNEELKKILAQPTVASKEEIIRRYDFEVQGNTIGKPFAGEENDGPSDAAIIRPEFGKKAVVIANGINPRYSAINSYHMAASAIDEAARNITASGGDIEKTALLDNFCWANTDNPEKLGSLVMAAKACHDIATAYETPFISGKDSLHNEYKYEGGTIGIPDTLLITAVSVIDAKEAITMDIKEEGNTIYITGKTYDELGGSQYYELHGKTGKNAPKVRAEEAFKAMKALTKAMRTGLVKSCHDCSEGGIAVAAAEMAFAGGIGISINGEAIPNETDKDYKLLFSESNSRFLTEVTKENEKEFEKMTRAAKIGTTTKEKKLTIKIKGKKAIDATLDELKKAWKGTIKW